MRRAMLSLLVACLVASPLSGGIIIDPDLIIGRRGDANHDGSVNIADSIYLTNFLFKGGPAPPCMNEADANHDGAVDLSDAIFLQNFLYGGGPQPPAPGPYSSSCSETPAPHLSCAAGCP